MPATSRRAMPTPTGPKNLKHNHKPLLGAPLPRPSPTAGAARGWQIPLASPTNGTSAPLGRA
ncbi:hypothetical protein PsYK624_108270 [Phanerochaete sordida]|uniref:Uncharacterized protein n=1 Tax=Phanerochaete sordida TaxID=48140 RepID=A0A9P3GGS1_9APHY|nr:hypothetical protein PsYK624_108270 [Phanerochaete sordida]